MFLVLLDIIKDNPWRIVPFNIATIDFIAQVARPQLSDFGPDEFLDKLDELFLCSILAKFNGMIGPIVQVQRWKGFDPFTSA